METDKYIAPEDSDEYDGLPPSKSERAATGGINVPMNRVGDWIQTYTGQQFWPFDPRPEEIRIDDIAHALSQLCRFGGHCRKFYSVAEHCVRVSLAVRQTDALHGLLHDASEAYLIDVPRPIKRHPSMAFYREAEARLEAVIFERFGLSVEMPASVRVADNRMLLTEKRDITRPTPYVWTEAQAANGGAVPFDGEPIDPWTSEVARCFFKDRFYELGGRP